MIVNFRGTSGSGKSTAMRNVMAAISDDWRKWYRSGRKQPFFYTAERNGQKFAVMGHYETACGGCDTITKVDDTYAEIRRLASEGYHVLYEGLLICSEFQRTVPLSKDHKLLVIALDVPLQVCLDSVNARRHARNPDLPPVNPDNTARKHGDVQRTVKRLQAEGVVCEWHDRDSTVLRTLEVLGCLP